MSDSYNLGHLPTLRVIAGHSSKQHVFCLTWNTFQCFLFYLSLCMIVLPVCMFVHLMCILWPLKSREGTRSLGTGGRNSCEPPWVVGNQTRVLCKSRAGRPLKLSGIFPATLQCFRKSRFIRLRRKTSFLYVLLKEICQPVSFLSLKRKRLLQWQLWRRSVPIPGFRGFCP